MSPENEVCSPFVRSVDVWRSQGWLGTIPLPERKKSNPPGRYTGGDGEWPSDEVIDEWRKWSDANICLRLPDMIIGLDVDGYKDAGRTSLQELVAKCGELPATWSIVNRDDGISGTYLFRLPEPTQLVGGVPGIELLQHHHRYVILPPSVHPEDREYKMVGPDGEPTDTPPRPDDVPLLPAAWLDELRKHGTGDNGSRARARMRTTGEWASCVTKLLGEATAAMRSGESRHDAALKIALAFLRYEQQSYPGATDALDMFRDQFITSITTSGEVRTLSEANAEWARIVDGGRVKVASTPPTITAYDPSYTNGLFAGRDAPTPTSPTRSLVGPTLPSSFWDERPVFGHIRDAARHSLVAPFALLLCVLARVVAGTHPFLGLPDIPRYGSLNLYGVLVGASGAGKGASMDRAKRLISIPDGLEYRELPVGSGEGMVRSFFTKVDVEIDGKTRQEWQQTVQSVLFRVDEGLSVKALGERQGQTTNQTLLQGFSGEELGHNYTDPDKRGIIARAHNYRMVVIVGIQPENGKFLLDDAISGLPQRMLWASCVDPDAPPVHERPDDPGPLLWTPPAYQEAEIVKLTGDGTNVAVRHALAVDRAIQTELLERRHAVLAGNAEHDALDSHRDLLRLKVAGALALLDERLDIDADDWRLAGIIVDTSVRVRTWMQQRIRDEQGRIERQTTARTKHRAAATEAGRAEQEAIERKAINAARWAHGRATVTKSDLSHRLHSDERSSLFPRVLGVLVDRGWMRHVDGKYEATAAEDDSEEWPL